MYSECVDRETSAPLHTSTALQDNLPTYFEGFGLWGNQRGRISISVYRSATASAKTLGQGSVGTYSKR